MEVAQCCEAHLRNARAAALAALSEWTGPHCLEAGRRADRSAPLGRAWEPW